MARHNLAARSLRHLRFARRMMAGQPLLARAADGYSLPVHITLDGRELPMGHVLRHLPQPVSSDAYPAYDASATTTTSAARVAPHAETLTAPGAESALRLLPRIPEHVQRDEIAADTPVAPSYVPTTPSAGASATPETPAWPALPAPLPLRPDGRRPRSRIVELPGVVIHPLADEPDEQEAPSASRSNTKADEQPASRIDTATAPAEPATAPVDPAPPEQPAQTPRRRVGKAKSNASATTPATSSQPRASDALFLPTDEEDRSPAAWLERLRRAANPGSAAPEPPMSGVLRRGNAHQRKGRDFARATEVSMPAPSSEATPPTPSAQPSDAGEEQPATLPASSRTMLHTLTGVDPASVRIYRGTQAARIASAQHADALTDGDAIALGAGHATNTPETLGLLAHELTHVAQRRTPRFVPPIARVTTPQSTQPQPPVATSPLDQEAQATLVEARVIQAASAQINMAGGTAITSPAGPAAAAVPQPDPSEEPVVPGQPQQPARFETRPIWGNLPAPWEPLPDWLVAPTPEPQTAPGMPQTARQAAPTSAPPSSPSPSGTSGAQGTQRAEQGRSLPTSASELAQPTRGHEGGAPEPDLDALAQQVHAILKRRLAAERRRFG